MKKVLVLASVASMIDQFNIPNIELLQNLGCSVDVACNFKEGSTCSDEKIQELKIKLKKMGVKYYQIDFSRNITNISSNLKALSQVQRLVKKNEYLFIHCHSPIGGIVGRIAGKLGKTKVIYTAHGFHFFKGAPLKNWLIYYPIEKICSYMTDVLITINKEDYALAKKKMYAKNVEYIPGVGVDLKKFKLFDVDKEKIRESIGIPKKGFMLLSVGELSSRKNHQIVIKALAKLNNPNIYYCIVGIGPDKCHYEELIKSNDLEKNVFLLGHRSDIAELCLISDCFVHPSIREGLGIAPLEGMACGLPLISSYVNGIKDYTENGVSGCCINPFHIEEMVMAIEKMYSDPVFCENCGKNNKITVQNFSLEKSQEVMKLLYDKNIRGGVLNSILERNILRESLGCSTKDIVLISVGEINANKNHEIIIRALSKVNDCNVKYWICGVGNKKSKLEVLVNELHLQDRVLFLGFQTDVSKFLIASDIFCFPSKREGLGLAAIEAMSVGLPLITSNIHGINDYSVSGLSGYSCKPDKVDEFVNAIKKLCYDEEMRHRMGKHNIISVEKYDLTQVMPTMESIYKKMIV